MNFRDIALKLKESAADAAKRLPTFDDMAAKDTFIHTDDDDSTIPATTTTTTTTTTTKSSKAMSSSSLSFQNDGDIESDSHSKVASIRKQQQQEQKQEKVRKETLNSAKKKRQTSSATLLPVVQETFSHNKNNRQYGGDLEMTTIRNDSSEVTLNENHHQDSPAKKSKAKNPNRFFDDLEMRMSQPQQQQLEYDDILHTNNIAVPQTQQQQQQQQQQHRPDNNNNNNNNRWNWLRDQATLRFDQFIGKPIINNNYTKNNNTKANNYNDNKPAAPLSRPKPTQPAKDNNLDKDDDMLNVVTTTSSSVLGQEDMAKLAQFKSKQTFDPFTMFSQLLNQNPQFGFIAFTLVLAAVVFFYTRSNTIQDNVT